VSENDLGMMGYTITNRTEDEDEDEDENVDRQIDRLGRLNLPR
jgi:hypothetical protein